MNASLLQLLGRALCIGGAAGFVFGCSSVRPNQGLHVVTGLVSHNLCSKVFVSGLDPDQAYAEDLRPRPGMGLVNWAVRYDVDAERKHVDAHVAGAFTSRAVYQEGFGCLVVHGDETADPPAHGVVTDEPPPVALLPEIAGAAAVEPTDDRLRAALDRAFAEPDHPPYRRTTAVIVVHDGRVIAERYAPGYGVATPLLG